RTEKNRLARSGLGERRIASVSLHPITISGPAFELESTSPIERASWGRMTPLSDGGTTANEPSAWPRSSRPSPPRLRPVSDWAWENVAEPGHRRQKRTAALHREPLARFGSESQEVGRAGSVEISVVAQERSGRTSPITRVEAEICDDVIDVAIAIDVAGCYAPP